MSKPDINGLGVSAELTLHEKALREAQSEISALKAENARLREELRRERSGRSLLTDEQIWDAIVSSSKPPHSTVAMGYGDENPLAAKSIHLPPIPAPHPHHSTVGLGMDGEGRVSG